MKLCMIGTGYVGLVSGVCFSDLGNDVICVDKDLDKINLLKKGKIPIYEPGLSELVIKNYKNNRLNFSTNLNEAVRKSDIIFICVGTPTKKNSNSADLSQVYSVGKEISKSINKFKIIITKSTVPVTTGDELEKIISKKARLSALQSLLKEQQKKFNKSFVGKNLEILFEKKGRYLDQYVGRSIYNQSVFTKSQTNLINTIQNTHILNSTDFALESSI